MVRVADKKFVGKNVLYANIFKKNDKRTIYNVCLPRRQGWHDLYQAIRRDIHCTRPRIRRNARYTRLQNHVLQSQPNGEAEIIKVTLKPNPRIRKIIFEEDFSRIGIKGRQAIGNMLTRNPVHKITLKQRGGSTLGGRKVWFDRDVLRLNYDGRGEYPGRIPERRTDPRGAEQRRLLYHQLRRNNHYEDGSASWRSSTRTKCGRPCSTTPTSRTIPPYNASASSRSSRKQNYPGRQQEQQAHPADRRILSATGSCIRRTRQLSRTDGHRGRRVHRHTKASRPRASD